MPEPKWLVGARELVGLKEVVGSKHEGKVLRFFADAGHAWVKDDETAWCAAFANAMLRKAGINGTGSLAARSFLKWGTSLSKPRVGAITVFRRGKSAWQGHVAFFLREVGNKIEVLGGNQGNAVSIAQYPKSSLLGYRWPKEAPGAEKPAATPSKPSPAPEPAAPEFTRTEVKDVQERLLGHGYVRVGAVDGLIGDNTKGAIRDFRANNDLPAGEHIDQVLIDKLKDPSAVRPVIAPERANATVKDLRDEGSEIIQASDVQKIGTGVVVVGTAAKPIVDAITETSDSVANVAEKLGPFESLFQLVVGNLGWIIWAVIIAAGLFVGWKAYKIARARVRDHRLGNTAVVNLPAKVEGS